MLAAALVPQVGRSQGGRSFAASAPTPNRMGAPTRSVRVKLCFLRLFAYCLWATAGARFVYPLADKWAVVMQGVYLLINVAVCMSVLKDDPIVDLACRLLAKMPCGAEVQLGGMECLLPYASVCALQAACKDAMWCRSAAWRDGVFAPIRVSMRAAGFHGCAQLWRHAASEQTRASP
eukprot:GEMP01070199.1.p1 GENE.GEMP01070199.1~~GEMP01070199.1.p1  ORF type:complete len:177 (+),score=32.97 GEMP01070199.1:101-631(+)